jgi:EAL domain-containing protein (putative c-di-GMP-specific phosphodiesterase class I)
LSRVAEPVILFPLIATLVLSVIWTGTIGLIRLKQADAAHDAAASSRELLGTYEAQVVRALREIDQTLTLVKFVHEGERGHGALAELRNKGLLPPDLLFTVSIADRQGAVVESTHPAQTVDVADEKYFQAQRAGDSFIISEPAREPTGDVSLRFSRRLDDSDGTFDGVVIVTVGASYFVSGYESTKLGERGVLGIVGTDGIVRVRRTGDSEFSGDAVDYGDLVPRPDAVETATVISTSSWDAVPRWTSARELYGFPLAVFVGLSADERLAGPQRDTTSYEDLSSTLASTGMDPRFLEFEINEKLLMEDAETTRRILSRLKELGVRIAIDDFGSGYTSLATLQRFPLDTIKIDRSFIHSIAIGGDDTGLAESVIAMGKNLSLTVVAQGVETSEQADFLRAHACDEIQGFYFNRPLPAELFTQLLLAQRSEITDGYRSVDPWSGRFLLTPGTKCVATRCVVLGGVFRRVTIRC